MRSIRKYLVGFSTAALVLGTIATGAGVSAAATQGTSLPFSDIGNSSSADAITFLAQAGIVSGVGGGLYDPGAPVTRAEMAKIVVNLVGKGEVATALQNVPPSFTDASMIPSWAWGYVNVAQDMGIVNGYPDGSFKPDNPVSDVEATAMLVRAIGDNEPGIVQGTWPGNYVAAAFDLGVNTGVAAYIANVPASRADIAQMAFNTGVNAATAQAITANGVTTWQANGTPLWDSGVGGYKVVTGTVTGVSSTNISISTSSGSTSYNWESTYYLPTSVTDASALIGVTVNVLVDPSGNASDVTLGINQSTSQKTGTLGDSNTAVPAGYFRMNSGVGGYEHIVTTSYACSQEAVDGADCSGNLYLLFNDGSTVPVATYNSSSTGTVYAVNVPATGLGSDSSAEVSGITATSDDDAVTYAVNSNGDVTYLAETNVTTLDNSSTIGVVQSTVCASGCDNTPGNAGDPQNQLEVDGNWYNVQSYTEMTLNGASTTLSKSLDNAVAYLDVVGNQAGAGENSGPNLASIAIYQNSVSGTVTSVTEASNAPNAGGANPNDIVSFTLSPSSGASQSYTADNNFNANGFSLAYGTNVTVGLDQAGEARILLASNTVSSTTVALVTGTGTEITSGGQTDTLIVNDSAGSGQTLTLPNGVSYTGKVYSSTYWNQVAPNTGNGNNGMILFVTNNSGQAQSPVTAGAEPELMSYESPAALFHNNAIPSTDYLQVVSSSGSGAVLGLYCVAGTSGTSCQSSTSNGLDYMNANDNPFFSIVNGGSFDVANNPATWIGSFSGLDTGEGVGSVAVWTASVNGVPYYAIMSTQ